MQWFHHTYIAMDSSPLRKLPIELRLDIYERVLFVDGGVKVTLKKPQSKKRRPSREAYASQPHILALHSTCREIAETAGLIFRVNRSWIFAQMDDDSTSWGKRVRQWSQQAGEQCLQRAQSVQYDIGGWCSSLHCYPRGDTTASLLSVIGSMYQNLPKQLRQCEQTFKLRLNWSCAMPRCKKQGDRERSPPLTFVVPMWTTAQKIEAVFLASYKCDHVLPKYDEHPTRKARIDMRRVLGLAEEIDIASCIVFVKDVQRRLEEHAIDQ